MDKGSGYNNVDQLGGIASNAFEGKMGIDERLIMVKLLKLSGYRFAPMPLKRYFWLSTSEFYYALELTDKTAPYMVNDFAYFESLSTNGLGISDDDSSLIYIHLQGVHPPHNMDENIQWVEESDFISQGKGSFKIVFFYLDQLKNLEMYKQAVGDRIQVLWMGGTDFGTQHSTFTSVEIFRKLYKPFFKKVTDWVHNNTDWKIFFHTCGSIVPLLDDLHEAGIDILNPVQCSAAGMDPAMLKEQYGDKFVFWGAGVDTQKTLPYGTPDDVKRQVKERLEIFSKGGGFVFNTIHNIVGKTPIENVMAMFEALEDFRGG